MDRRSTVNALIVWALLLLLLAIATDMAFSDTRWIHIFGVVAWCASAIAFGGWFIWIQHMSNRWTCYNCEGKKHRK